MKLGQLKNFVAVAEHGSVQGAARHQGVTQPAVTRSIRELERELGAPLFERSGTGMTLTEIGTIVFNRARGVQTEIGRIQDEVAQLKGNSAGTITIGLSFVAHAGLLPKVIGAFRRREPGVQVEVRETLFANVERDIYNGGIDFYVGPIPPGEGFFGKLAVEPLFENRRQIFCRRGHPLANASSLAELADASWVAMSASLNPQNDLARQFEHYGLASPNVAVWAQTMLSMMLVAGASDLLAALPQQIHGLVGIKSTLVRIPISEPLVSATICIVKRASVPLTPAAEMLSDLFRRAAIAHVASLPATGALTR